MYKLIILAALFNIGYSRILSGGRSMNRNIPFTYDNNHRFSTCLASNGTEYSCFGDAKYCCANEDECCTYNNTNTGIFIIIFFSIFGALCIFCLLCCLCFCIKNRLLRRKPITQIEV